METVQTYCNTQNREKSVVLAETNETTILAQA